MHFESPWAFLLLLLLPVLLWLRRRTAKRGAVRFSTVRNANRAGKSLRQTLAPLTAALQIAAIVCLVVALARPQTGREKVRDVSRGIAVEMVVDRSGSMGAEMEYNGRKMNRLEVVKQVFEKFVLGDGADLPGRPDDLIGMITFARYPDTVCPLTLAHGALPQFLESVKLVQRRDEDGTNIGDALALAAARLQTADETLARQNPEAKKSYKIKSKVVILLSDGENNCGKRDPVRAAELAKKWGIRVYTIAIGGGEAMQSIRTPFGVYKVPLEAPLDTTVLQTIAKTTGGFFRQAQDAESLQAIYEDIDKMEKSEIESVRFVDYRESFIPFALAGLLLTAGAIILDNTLFRKVP
ncbi:MAG: VWA domain-containing protein [Desulfobacterales bacterium]|jgi:Ca-activated chloride channel family protein